MIAIEAKPRRLALSWLPIPGFYILAADGVCCSFTDPDEAVTVIRAAIDTRLDDIPRGSC